MNFPLSLKPELYYRLDANPPHCCRLNQITYRELFRHVSC